jgi:hypothetical protein
MKESQARVNSNPAFPTEQNLALTRYAILDELDQVLSSIPSSQSEAKPIGLPNRPNRQQPSEEIDELLSPRSSRQQRKGRKIQAQSASSASDAKKQLASSIRRLRQIGFQLSPDELKRLKLCAETINQLLMEQAMQSERPNSKSNRQKPSKKARSPTVQPTKKSREAILPNLNGSSPTSGDQNILVSPVQPEVNNPSGEIGQDISQLLIELEAEIATNLDWQQTKQEAVETAEALRSLSSRKHLSQLLEHGQRISTLRPVRSPLSQRSGKAPKSRFRQLLQIPQRPLAQLGDAILWVMGSAIVRIVLEFLLSTFPGFKVLLILLQLVPVVFAIYLLFFVPRIGVLSIYRPFLLLLGLLLGGRV